MDPLIVGGVPEHFNLPWRLADAAGHFDAAGVAIDWQDQVSGTGQMMAALAEGELDIAVALTDGAIRAIAEGNPSRIVRVYTSSPLVWGVHVEARSPIREIADITSDHKFAISRYGSGSNLMAYVLASQNDLSLDPSDSFEIVGDLEGGHRALVDGTADIFLWDRFMTSPLVEAGELFLADEQPTPWPSFVVVVRNDALENRRREVVSVLDIAARWAVMFEELPLDMVVALVARGFGINPSIAAEWRSVTSWDHGNPVDPAEVERAQSLLADFGVVTSPVSVGQLVDPL